MNVEISTFTKSFKYIFKLIHKGSDKAEIRLKTVDKDRVPQTYADLDELKEWDDSCYDVSAHIENIWLPYQCPQSHGP